MKKKADTQLLSSNTIYILLTIIFLMGMFFPIKAQAEGANIWEQHYAQEITKIIDTSEVGTKIKLDVHKATTIASKRGVSTKSEIFEFNNAENKVCIKLSPGRKTCYNYFNNVDIIYDLKFASGSKAETNLLIFELVEKKQNE